MGIRSAGKQLVEKSSFLKKLFRILTNRIKIGGNTLFAENIHFAHNQIHAQGKNQELTVVPTSFLRDCKVTMTGNGNTVFVDANSELYGSVGQCIYIEGSNNRILIGKNCKIRNSIFFIHGSNNELRFEDNISCYRAEFDLRQDNNQIVVGEGTSFHGREGYPVHIVADEGSGIMIGKDCMLSKDIQIRSSDSHSIVDLTGKRLNPAEDVVIGDHVWISLGATLLKGTHIPSHCIVAADAVCTKEYKEELCVIAGNPAKVVKWDVDWDRRFV